MEHWVIWFGLAGGLVILEMFSGTFYLLMIAIGAAAGGLLALTGAGVAMQLAVAGVVGAAATYALRKSRWGKKSRQSAMRDPNVNLDIGQTLLVHHWGGDGRTSRSSYRGALWDIELEHGGIARPGLFVIREVRGSRLIVTNAD